MHDPMHRPEHDGAYRAQRAVAGTRQVQDAAPELRARTDAELARSGRLDAEQPQIGEQWLCRSPSAPS